MRGFRADPTVALTFAGLIISAQTWPAPERK
jgi:hypothetical protein